MINKVLIIAPHPDDEINLAGQMIVSLNKQKIETYVVYTTNGDAERKIGNKRLEEAIRANCILGIDESHVIFLGYPDGWAGRTHIYNAPENELLFSGIGKKETNSIKTHPEYCYQKTGAHHSFTRSNFVLDMQGVIEELMPDCIIAPEFDSHPDHRAASLFLDEIMCNILRRHHDYNPIILKKYIHEGVWYGKKDYYSNPMPPTLTAGKREYADCVHDLDSPCFTWNERMAYFTEESTRTMLLTNNIIYKAAKKHRMTTAWYEMQRVINADMVYWHRPLNILNRVDNIVASSGNVSYLNDFKRYDSNDITSKQGCFSKSEGYCWQPSDDDLERKITIHFDSPIKICMIRIFEDCNYHNHIVQMNIFADGVKICSIEPMRDGEKTEYRLQELVEISTLSFQIESFIGKPGIAEIEVFDRIIDSESILPLQSYVAVLDKKTDCKLAKKTEESIFKCRFLISFKMKYEIVKFFRQLKGGD